MKVPRYTLLVITAGLVMCLLTACKKPEASDAQSEGKNDEHGHEESAPGASFKAGKGVLLSAETRKILDVQVVEVGEQKLPVQIRLNLQVFGEVHRHAVDSESHQICDVHGSAYLPFAKAAMLRAGLPVDVQSRSNGLFHGTVLQIRKEPTIGESEIVVGVSNATTELPPGEFVVANIGVPRDEPVIVIPRSAVLRTSEGTFVYTVNGDAFFRTAIKLGSEADGFQEVTDGLLAGDFVATKAVETLYLIELRATKGGGHSH